MLVLFAGVELRVGGLAQITILFLTCPELHGVLHFALDILSPITFDTNQFKFHGTVFHSKGNVRLVLDSPTALRC